jgi:hypothetical protein
MRISANRRPASHLQAERESFSRLHFVCVSALYRTATGHRLRSRQCRAIGEVRAGAVAVPLDGSHLWFGLALPNATVEQCVAWLAIDCRLSRHR